ncbi:hypothetical protein RFI_30469, partial [Reticulomyxa filosa]
DKDKNNDKDKNKEDQNDEKKGQSQETYDYKNKDIVVVDIASQDFSPASPRFSPDKTKLIYLTTNKFDIRIQWATSSGSLQKWSDAKTVIDIPDTVTSTDVIDKKAFPGVYSTFETELCPRCFISNDEVVLSTIWGHCVALLRVNVATKQWTRVDTQSWFASALRKCDQEIARNVVVIDCCAAQSEVLFAVNSLQRVESAHIWKCSDNLLYPLASSAVADSTLEDIGCPHFETHVLHNVCADDDTCKFEALYFQPGKGNTASRELFQKDPVIILIPHGGPHSAVSPGWSGEIAAFLTQGYAVIC